MGPPHHRLLLILSLSSLFFFFSSEAFCVPRNLTHSSSPSPATKEAAPPPKVTPPPDTITPPTSDPPKVAPPTSIPKPISNPVNNIVLDPAIDRVCKSTDYPDLCFSSLKPYLNGKVDVITILNGEIQACRDRTIAASAEALEKAQDTKTDAKTASNLKDCKRSYDDALDNLKQTEDAIKISDIGTVNTMLSAVVTNFGDCDGYFSGSTGGPGNGPEDGPGIPNPMASPDETLKSLASNCLAIASLINPLPS